MDYSFWSGEVQGKEERLAEDFRKNPTVGYALFCLLASLKMRRDFVSYKRKGLISGDLPPFDKSLMRNLFYAIRRYAIAKSK